MGHEDDERERLETRLPGTPLATLFSRPHGYGLHERRQHADRCLLKVWGSRMVQLDERNVRTYLEAHCGGSARILSISVLGQEPGAGDVKGYGYGAPVKVEYELSGQRRSVVIETVMPGPFGHEHMADRAQILLWSHAAFNRLPRHVHSLDVGGFQKDGQLVSLGNVEEFFILNEFVSGEGYYRDLERLRDGAGLDDRDLARADALCDYLAGIHQTLGGRRHESVGVTSALTPCSRRIMFEFLFRFGIVVAGAVLWLTGLRLFIGAELPRRRKVGWSACLVVTGALIGLLLSRAQVWEKFLILLALLPLLAAADIFLLRSRRRLSFWIRACGFELGTVFGVAGITRFLCDTAGLSALLGTR